MTELMEEHPIIPDELSWILTDSLDVFPLIQSKVMEKLRILPVVWPEIEQERWNSEMLSRKVHLSQ